jgi:hypothetical protein
MCGRDKVSLEEVLDGNFPWTENDSEVGNVYSALSLNCFDTMFNTTDNHADNCNA